MPSMSLLLRPVVVSLFGLSAALTAHADSFTSSAASAASQSVGALSGSITQSSTTSSNSSSPGPTAAADYDVIRVADLGGERDLVRVHLAPSPRTKDATTTKRADDTRVEDTHAGAARSDRSAEVGSFTLDLPRAALGAQGVAVGDVINVRPRPYGLEFARSRDGEAFFLAVADDWLRDMQARPL
jgi:hypothetical protein